MIIPLCNTDLISDPGSKSFEIKHGRKTVSLFIVHKEGAYSAYINSCPHTGINLEWQEDQFLDLDKALIQCATHDALFMIDSGECIAGPCVGDTLQPLPITVHDDVIQLDL